MAKVWTEGGSILVAPTADREAARVSSAVRRVCAGAVSDGKGRFLLDSSLVLALAGQLPTSGHDWSRDAIVLLEAETSRIAQTELVRSKVKAALDDPGSFVGQYPYLSLLDSHQVQVLAVLSIENLEGLALFDEQGTGKTVSCICGFDLLRRRGAVEQLMVVCPKSMVISWAESIRVWFGDTYVVTVLSGTAQARSDQIGKAGDVLVLTYETACRDTALVKAWASRFGKRTMLVADESFFIKNPETHRARAVGDLRASCIRAVVACGTPAPNSPVDVVNQVNLVDRGYAFGNVRTTGVEDGDVIETVLRDRAIYLRRLKVEVLPDLPAKNFRRLLVPMSTEQQLMYSKLRDELLIEVRGVDDVTFRRKLANFLARRVALLQICSHPGALDPSYMELPGKIAALDDLLQELIEVRQEKVVLWSFYTFSLDRVCDRYRKYGVARIDGSVTSPEARSRAVLAFQGDPSVRLFVGNPAAAGAGLTLTAGRHAIYESFSNQAAHYLQSIDRIHRRGQTREVTYHVLLCKGTVEVCEYDRLLRKEAMAAHVLGDTARFPISREEFLADLTEQD